MRESNQLALQYLKTIKIELNWTKNKVTNPNVN